MSTIRYMTLTVQLADNRVLLHKKLRPGGRPMWSATYESLLFSNDRSPLIEVNNILKEKFGINPHSYSDDFAEIKQLTPISLAANRCIHPFIMRVRQKFNCRAVMYEEYGAMYSKDLVDAIINQHLSKFTPTASMLVAKLVNLKVL